MMDGQGPSANLLQFCSVQLVEALLTLRREEAKLLILLPNAEGHTPLQQAMRFDEQATLVQLLKLAIEQQRKRGESDARLVRIDQAS